jgi:hypothetical protein
VNRFLYPEQLSTDIWPCKNRALKLLSSSKLN